MSTPQVTSGPLTDADLPVVTNLIAAQETRWHARDPRLERAQEREEITSRLIRQSQEMQAAVLVARDANGQARGYALPTLFEVPPESELLAYFTPCNGTCEQLVVPAPDQDDAAPVLSALLSALTDQWQQRHTLLDSLNWPSTDTWVQPVLQAAGFQEASFLAYRPTTPLVESIPPKHTGLQVRQARPADEDALVALNRANVAHDASYSPFIQVVPTLEPVFRAQLARLWAGERVEEGVPLVVVVEHAGTVVGMAQTYLTAEAHFLPPARYAYLHEVIVRPEWRGQGVGRLLASGVDAAYAELGVCGSTLYFSPFNPLSSHFWPYLGFQPVVTNYMRRSCESTP